MPSNPTNKAIADEVWAAREENALALEFIEESKRAARQFPATPEELLARQHEERAMLLGRYAAAERAALLDDEAARIDADELPPAQHLSPLTYPLMDGNCCDDYRMLLDIAAERTECVVKTTGNETNVLDIYPPHEIQVRIPRDADTVFHIVRGNRPVGRHEVSFSLIMLPLGQGYGKIEGDANLMLAKYWVEAEPA